MCCKVNGYKVDREKDLTLPVTQFTCERVVWKHVQLGKHVLSDRHLATITSGL